MIISILFHGKYVGPRRAFKMFIYIYLYGAGPAVRYWARKLASLRQTNRPGSGIGSSMKKRRIKIRVFQVRPSSTSPPIRSRPRRENRDSHRYETRYRHRSSNDIIYTYTYKKTRTCPRSVGTTKYNNQNQIRIDRVFLRSQSVQMLSISRSEFRSPSFSLSSNFLLFFFF